MVPPRQHANGRTVVSPWQCSYGRVGEPVQNVVLTASPTAAVTGGNQRPEDSGQTHFRVVRSF